MRRFQFAGLSLILLTGACASNRGVWKPPPAPNEPIQGGIAEFQVTSYDGEDVSGRVVIGATSEPFVIDSRLTPLTVNIDVSTLHACGNGERIILQGCKGLLVIRPPKPDDIITIRPGHWYGGAVKLWVFSERVIGLGPDCLEADLVVRALDEREIAKIPLHAVRTDKPPAPPDGGAPPAPKPPAPPPGAP